MSERIAPFTRVLVSDSPRARPRLVGLMRWHYLLVGTVLLLLALGLFGVLYTNELTRIDVKAGLRFARRDKAYDQSIQVQMLAALVLSLMSLFFLRIGSQIGQRALQTLLPVRAAAFLLLGSLPISIWLWSFQPDIPGVPIGLVQTGLRVVALLLVAQAVVAIVYLVRTLSPGVRYALLARDTLSNVGLRRLRSVGIATWIIVVIGLGLALGILTDWLYELPVARPAPGELLYATTFDAFGDEWDIYGGRESVQIAQADSVGLTQDDAPVAGSMLLINNDSPYTNMIVFSVLARKFNDMDLRLTAQQLAGPDDNQFGVIFRYRDVDNFYAFLISSDGYYSLVKKQDGMFESVSVYGLSDVIHQGTVPNEIRILALGDTFQFFVNGQVMPLCLRGENNSSMWSGPGVCLTDDLTDVYVDRDFGQGRVALAAGTSADLSSEVVIGFDDLVIVGPDPDAIIKTLE